MKRYGRQSASGKRPITWAFVKKRPAAWIAVFFGAGLIHPGPGTWGSLAATLVYAFYAPHVGLLGALTIGAIAFVLGVWAAGRTCREMGVEDHGDVVIDEAAAMWLLLPFVPATPAWWAAAFVAFRFFDIVKCPPASRLDATVKGGFGVMVDDLVAAFYAWLFLYGVQHAVALFA